MDLDHALVLYTKSSNPDSLRVPVIELVIWREKKLNFWNFINEYKFRFMMLKRQVRICSFWSFLLLIINARFQESIYVSIALITPLLHSINFYMNLIYWIETAIIKLHGGLYFFYNQRWTKCRWFIQWAASQRYFYSLGKQVNVHLDHRAAFPPLCSHTKQRFCPKGA